MVDYSDPRPYKKLIWEVLRFGVKDATSGNGRVKDEAVAWIMAGNRRHSDFRVLCDLVGLDADACRERFMSGTVDHKAFSQERMGRG